MADALDHLSEAMKLQKEIEQREKKKNKGDFLKRYRLPKAQKFIFKKDLRANWGRFLDNHFDEHLHKNPWCVQRSAPGPKYQYTGQGLQHKHSYKFIERKNIDEEETKVREVHQHMYPETIDHQAFKPGDLLVFIVYNTSERYQYMTHHIPEKYDVWAKRTKEAIEERFPMVRVYIKSNQTTKAKPSILDHYATAQTIGAFEVLLV